jgi:hypothetical protein
VEPRTHQTASPTTVIAHSRVANARSRQQRAICGRQLLVDLLSKSQGAGNRARQALDNMAGTKFLTWYRIGATPLLLSLRRLLPRSSCCMILCTHMSWRCTTEFSVENLQPFFFATTSERHSPLAALLEMLCVKLRTLSYLSPTHRTRDKPYHSPLAALLEMLCVKLRTLSYLSPTHRTRDKP